MLLLLEVDCTAGRVTSVVEASCSHTFESMAGLGLKL